MTPSSSGSRRRLTILCRAVTISAAMTIGVYGLVAGIVNLYIPRVSIDHRPLSRNPAFLLKEFWHCFRLLWKDPLGQVSLAVTTLFWGAGATLQFIVLEWAKVALNLEKS